MSTSETTSVSLGYIIHYVPDVAASLTYYENAFGLARRFFTDEGGKAYGELETGATRLAFASLTLAREHLGIEPISPNPKGAPLSTEIAFTCADVPALYARALKAGAQPVSAPAQKPWGQVVAYLRDPDGYLVELCTPLG